MLVGSPHNPLTLLTLLSLLILLPPLTLVRALWYYGIYGFIKGLEAKSGSAVLVSCGLTLEAQSYWSGWYPLDWYGMNSGVPALLKKSLWAGTIWLKCAFLEMCWTSYSFDLSFGAESDFLLVEMQRKCQKFQSICETMACTVCLS